MKLVLLMVCKILSWDCYVARFCGASISALELPRFAAFRLIMGNHSWASSQPSGNTWFKGAFSLCLSLTPLLPHSHLPHTNRENKNHMQLHTLQLASNSLFKITSVKALKIFRYKRELARIILQRTNSLEYVFFYIGMKSHENYPIVKDIVWHVWFTQFHAKRWD